MYWALTEKTFTATGFTPRSKYHLLDMRAVSQTTVFTNGVLENNGILTFHRNRKYNIFTRIYFMGFSKEAFRQRTASLVEAHLDGTNIYEGREYVIAEKTSDFLNQESYPPITRVPLTEFVENRKTETICRQYASDTWTGLRHASETPTGFPADMITIEGDKEISNQKTSPTNIGLFLACIIAARDMQLIGPVESQLHIDTVLTSLEKARKHQGLFYNWYDTQLGDVAEEADSSLISTVDNAWLAAGLMTIRGASAPKFSQRANKIIKQMNFPLLYNKDRNLFFGGYFPNSQESTTWHYDILNTEARIASYVGISTFDIPPANYTRLGQFTPADTEAPSTGIKQQFSSWGGSMFEALMPTLFVPEQAWSPTWEESHRNYVRQQIQHGERDNNGFWGYSPCVNPLGIYQESGLTELAIRGYGVSHVITPHALFLSLPFMPTEAIETLELIKQNYPVIYKDRIGFSDSVDIQTGKVANSSLALDQAMSFIALFNRLSGNKMHDYFSSHIERAIRPLIEDTRYVQPLAV